MLWRVAIRTLLADRGKLLAGLIGVIFSVVLVNVQGGLFLGLIHKASLLVERGRADIWVGHKGMQNVDFPHDIPRQWIERIRGLNGVEAAEPMSIAYTDISLPGGGFEGVMVIGVEPMSDLGRAWDIVEGPEDALDQPNAVVFDVFDGEKLSNPQIGDLREIGGRRARIAAKSQGILGFLVTPYIFTTLERAAQFTGKDESTCSYILVRVRKGTDIEAVCQEIRKRLPHVDAYSAQEYAAISVYYWMTRAGLGISFGAATLLGLLVGLVMVGQTLYAMVLDRVTEFATLKAIGAGEREILTVLLGQASGIAIGGILIGLLLSAAVCNFVSTPRATIETPMSLVILSAVGVFAICLCSSMLPYLRVRCVDAHSVLQG